METKEKIKPQSLKELEKERPGIEVPKGKWRLALLQAGELIEKHGIEYEPAKTEKVLIKAAFAFWQQLFRTKDIAFFRELGDRMDGKTPQSVALTDADGAPVRFEKVVREIIDVPPKKDPLTIDHKTVQ